MKGGKKCYAPAGDNRYHSIFKGVDGCFAVNPSDTAPAVVAYKGQIQTTKRAIEADDFWHMSPSGSTVLEPEEIVTEIRLPKPAAGTQSAFLKYANRETIDFPIVNCVVVIGLDEARICLNAVHPHPYRAKDAEAVLMGGKGIDETIAEAAGEAAAKGAFALSKNKYKIHLAKMIVKRAILERK
jgi:xanthine dehydrogenase YagS FAD-binding subunit